MFWELTLFLLLFIYFIINLFAFHYFTQFNDRVINFSSFFNISIRARDERNCKWNKRLKQRTRSRSRSRVAKKNFFSFLVSFLDFFFFFCLIFFLTHLLGATTGWLASTCQRRKMRATEANKAKRTAEQRRKKANPLNIWRR